MQAGIASVDGARSASEVGDDSLGNQSVVCVDLQAYMTANRYEFDRGHKTGPACSGGHNGARDVIDIGSEYFPEEGLGCDTTNVMCKGTTERTVI